MASVVLNGDTSGQVTLTVPAVAGTNTVTVPAKTGTMALTSDIPATTLYAIGTYVIGRPQNTTNYAPDDTVAGSSLYSIIPSGRWNAGGPSWSLITGTGSIITADLVNVGTWRCMSRAETPIANTSCPGLWIRIS